MQPTEIDKKHEKEIAERKLEAHPESVSVDPSVPLFRPTAEAGKKGKEGEEGVMKGLKGDLNTVVDTFALTSVPREPYLLGLAGTLPYLATSLTTVYLSWDLNRVWWTDSNLLNSIMVSHATAKHWLDLLEPIQLGYGALIISFLGAIHWGLEYAEKAPSQPRTNFRYTMGVVAPAVAWPTLMLPAEWALTCQFLAFTMLYFADARAASRGWAPQWYGTYRFVLTFIVGSAIFVSLLGRAKVGDSGQKLSSQGLEDTLQKGTVGAEAYTSNWAKKEEEEKERISREKEEEKTRKEEEKNRKEEEEEKKAKNKGDGKGARARER